MARLLFIALWFLIGNTICGTGLLFSQQTDRPESESRSGPKKWLEHLEPRVRLIGYGVDTFGPDNCHDFVATRDGKFMISTGGEGLEKWDLETMKVVKRIEPDEGTGFSKLKISQDGKRLAVSQVRFKKSQLAEQQNKLVDVAKFDEVKPLAVPKEDSSQNENAGAFFKQISDFAFTPDGARVAIVRNNQIFVLDTNTGQVESGFQLESHYNGNLAMFNDRLAIPCGDDYRVKIFKLDDGSRVRNPDIERDKGVERLNKQPKSDIVAHSGRNSVVLTDYNRNKTLHLKDSKKVTSSSFSSDGKLFLAIEQFLKKNSLTNTYSLRIAIWDAQSGKKINQFQPLGCIPSRVKFSADGKSVLVSHATKSGVSEYPINYKARKDRKVFDGVATELTVDEKGQYFAATGWAQTCVVDLKSNKIRHSAEIEGAGIRISNDNRVINFTDTIYSTNGIWEMNIGDGMMERRYAFDKEKKRGPVDSFRGLMGTKEKESETKVFPTWILAFGSSHEAKKFRAISVESDFSFRVRTWVDKNGKPNSGVPLKFEAGDQTVSTFDPSNLVSSDGTTAVLRLDNKSFVFNMETGEQIQVIKSIGIASQITGDNKFLILITPKSRLEVWEIESGKRVHEKATEAIEVLVANQKKMMVLVHHSKSRPVEFYELGTWKALGQHATDTADRYSAGVSNDGSTLVMGLDDGRFEVWDLNTVLRRNK